MPRSGLRAALAGASVEEILAIFERCDVNPADGEEIVAELLRFLQRADRGPEASRQLPDVPASREREQHRQPDQQRGAHRNRPEGAGLLLSRPLVAQPFLDVHERFQSVPHLVHHPLALAARDRRGGRGWIDR